MQPSFIYLDTLLFVCWESLPQLLYKYYFLGSAFESLTKISSPSILNWHRYCIKRILVVIWEFMDYVIWGNFNAFLVSDQSFLVGSSITISWCVVFVVFSFISSYWWNYSHKLSTLAPGINWLWHKCLRVLGFLCQISFGLRIKIQGERNFFTFSSWNCISH